MQKLYIEQLTRELDPLEQSGKFGDFDKGFYAFEQLFNDALPTIKDHLTRLLGKINRVLGGYKYRESRLHLTEVKDRIKKALYQQSGMPFPNRSAKKETNAFNFFGKKREAQLTNELYLQPQRECWNDELSEDNKRD